MSVTVSSLQGRVLVDYSSFQHSILSLLRMAVGDFDYTELAYSQNLLGPLLFWIYIFLMFFVVMSMFVALISEAYESAREDSQGECSGGGLRVIRPSVCCV